jgi:hypothetical protein
VLAIGAGYAVYAIDGVVLKVLPDTLDVVRKNGSDEEKPVLVSVPPLVEFR